jgi:hypothetical protein
LQWLAAARDRLRVAEPPRFRRACRRHPARPTTISQPRDAQ